MKKKKPLPGKAMKRTKGGAGDMRRSRVTSLTITFDSPTTV